MALLVSSALTIGCEPAATSPDQIVTLHPSFSEASGFEAVNLQLRPAEASEATMWGELTLLVGVPPNPICRQDTADATIAVCGVIHNPDLQSLEGGELRLTFSRTGGEVLLRFEAPPNPVCDTYLVNAVATVPLPEQNPGPPNVDVVFRSNLGSIVGGNPGPPTLNPGPPTGREQNPGPPVNPEANPGPPQCQITFAGD
jgi:hypothetical protein